MHKISSDGSSNGRFVEENLAQNIPGTLLSAQWLNTIQDELINLFKALGGTDAALSLTVNDQIGKAMTTKLTAIEQQLKDLNAWASKIHDTVNDLRSFVVDEIGKSPTTIPVTLPADTTVVTGIMFALKSLFNETEAKKVVVTKDITALPEKVIVRAEEAEPEEGDPTE